MTSQEAGVILMEMANKDASIATFFLVHNAIGQSVMNALGDEEQRKRFLTDTINLNKICCFGLTEPDNGSDASALKTTATRTKGGWLINGRKRWIGNATFADYINVWARNPEDGNNIQCFVVEKGSKGLQCNKIENKYSLRMVQNADIILDNVFVPDHNKLTLAKNFGEGTKTILESSRLMVAWLACGVGVGAYEAALAYALKRIQFKKPIASFQLNQEKLSRMLALNELNISHLMMVSELFDQGKASMGLIARAKAIVSKNVREVVALAREMCGGNGIILDNQVMKQFIDIEGIYTYEGTYDINMLISGREITGGLSSFK